MLRFAQGNLPPVETFDLYRKVRLTQAVRILEPFSVETPEGVMECLDGYLALDAKGRPYPIAADVFEQVYVRAD